ncbi:MAG: gliding motility protein GldM [Flavobacteriales bacterium]|nr:gliding motility protein GldM [Flavobacteriales bacterium]
MAGNHMSEMSPRQRMINMMYLVLTALLALNISKDMLKAFAKVNNSLKSNLSNINDQSDVLYSKFSDAAENAPLKVGPSFEVADTVKNIAEDFRSYVDELNAILIEKTGGYKDDGIELAGADNKSVVSNFMLMKPNFKGKEFREQINNYKNYLLSLDIVSENEELKNIIHSSFNTDDFKKDDAMVSWEYGTFNNVPLIAVLTFLSQYQVDASTIESKIVENLYASVSADDIKMTSAEAQVISSKNYVMEGDSFRAQISIAAFDSTSKPLILVTDVFFQPGDTIPDYSYADTIPEDQIYDGKGFYNIPASGIGNQKRAAKIILATDKGDVPYERIFEYQVAKPMAVVSPTKMNVFYYGVPNPIDISVPGFSPEDLQVSGSGISIKKIKPGKYEATVLKKNSKEAKVVVKANGKAIGKPIEFRVDKIPNPVAAVGGKSESKMSKNKLLKAQGVAAKLKNFPFDLKYEVTSYDVRLQVGQFPKTFSYKKTNLINEELRSKFKKLKSGSSVTFKNIKAKGPDGIKSCNAVVLEIQ